MNMHRSKMTSPTTPRTIPTMAGSISRCHACDLPVTYILKLLERSHLMVASSKSFGSNMETEDWAGFY